MKSSTKGVIFLALLVLSFLIIAGIFMFSGQPDPIKYNEALELIVEGDIKHVYVEGFQAKAKKTQTSSKYDYVFNIPSRADFANDVIREFNAKYGDGDNQITSLLQIAEDFDFAIEFNDPNAGSIWQYLPYLWEL